MTNPQPVSDIKCLLITLLYLTHVYSRIVRAGNHVPPDSCPLPSGGGRVRREDHGARVDSLYPRQNLLIRLPPAHRPMIPFRHLHTTPGNKYGIKKSILSFRPTVHTIKKTPDLLFLLDGNFRKCSSGYFL